MNRIRNGFRLSRVGILLVVVALLLSACQTPEFLRAELPNDGPPIATSQGAARRFAEKVASASQRAAETKRFRIILTQKEVTSFLNIGSEIAKQLQSAYGVDSLAELEELQGAQALEGAEGIPEWVKLLQQGRDTLGVDLPDASLRLALKEPQVYFKGSGQIIIRGYGEALGQRQPLRLVLAPHASEGELVLDFVEGTLGPVPVPETLVDLVGKGLAHLVLAGRDYVEISRIRVTAGKLVLDGRYTGKPLAP